MTPPKTEAEWCLYRAELNCNIGLNALQALSEEEQPSPTQHALFTLIHAVRELAGYFQEVEKRQP